MCCTLYIVLENKVGYTNPWVHQEAKQHHRVHKTKPRVHREAKQHHRVHKKEDHRHQGTQIGHQTDDSPCAHKGHLTGLPCASIDQVTRGVLYAKFLSIRYVIDIFILQDSLINIDIFQKNRGDN